MNFFPALRARRIEYNRRWILSLDKAQLLCLTMEPIQNTGLDGQDLDYLVQLTFNSYAEGQKDAIINRIAEHLREDFESRAWLHRTFPD